MRELQKHSFVIIVLTIVLGGSTSFFGGQALENVAKISDDNDSIQSSRVAQAAGTHPTLASIPPNTALWLGRYAPENLAGCNTYSTNITTQSRFTYDSVNKQMLFFGGGHASTPRTDVDVLDLKPGSDLQWHRAYPPTPVSDLIDTNLDRTTARWITTGHPISVHTYDLMPFDPNTGTLVKLGGSGPIAKCTTDTSRRKFDWTFAGRISHYHPVTKQWSSSAVGTIWRDPSGPSSEYDPVSKKIVILSRHELITYDPVAQVITRHKSFVNPALSYGQNLLYSPLTDKMYQVLHNGDVFEIALDRNNFANTTITAVTGITGTRPPLGLPPTRGMDETGWAYDSTNHVIGGGVTNGIFYAWNPVTKVWTAKAMTPSPTTLDMTQESMYYTHAIDYDPVNNVFIFLSRRAVGRGAPYWSTFAYKYDATVGTVTEIPMRKSRKPRLNKHPVD